MKNKKQNFYGVSDFARMRKLASNDKQINKAFLFSALLVFALIVSALMIN